MQLRTNRDAHPGYVQTGGPPKDKNAKTKKQLAAEEKAAKAAKAKAKTAAYKEIAALEKANASAFTVDNTPRPAPAPKKGKNKKTLPEPEPSPEPEPTSESESDHPSKDGELSEDDEEGPEGSEAKDQESESGVPDPDDEQSEPPSDLEKTIKKKSKGKPSVRQMIDEMKENDMDMDVDEGSPPQETPLVSRVKRLRAESAPQDAARQKKAKTTAIEDPEETLPMTQPAVNASASKKKSTAPLAEDEDDDKVEITSPRKDPAGKGKKKLVEVVPRNETDEDDSDTEVPSRILGPSYQKQKRIASASEVRSEDEPDSRAANKQDKRSAEKERAAPQKNKRSEKEGAADVSKPTTSNSTGRNRDQGAVKSKSHARDSRPQNPAPSSQPVDKTNDGLRQTSAGMNKDDDTSNEARSKRQGENKRASVEEWAKGIKPSTRPAQGSQSSSKVPSLSRSAKTSSSQASVLTSGRSALSSQVAVKKTSGKRRRNDEEEPVIGGLSDHDELDGEEFEDAQNSPVKGKQRLNSNAIIAVKKSKAPKTKTKKASKPRKRPSNRAISPECHVDDAWTKKVIPTMIFWLGCQQYPWNPDPERILDALEIICAEVYEEDVVEMIPLDNKKDKPYASQRFKDRWRNKMSSSASSILISFFESHPDLAHSNEARADYARWALQNSRFCYSKAKLDEPKRWRGAFHGALVILSFSTHFNCMQDHLAIDDLDSDFQDRRPRGALAIACSAMTRSLMLWRDGGYTIEAVQQAKETGTALKVQARVNKSTGRKTGSYAAFSATHWKDNTNDYLQNIVSLSTESMDEIIELAKAAAAKTKKTEEASSSHGCRKLKNSNGPSQVNQSLLAWL